MVQRRFNTLVQFSIIFLKAWNDFNKRYYKKRGFLQFYQRLPSCHGKTVTEGKKFDILKLVYLKQFVINKCENIKL